MLRLVHFWILFLFCGATLAGDEFPEDQASEALPHETIQFRINPKDETKTRQLFGISSSRPCLNCQERQGLSKWEREMLLVQGRSDNTTIVRIHITFHMTATFRLQFDRQADIAVQLENMLRKANEGFTNSRIPIRLILHRVVNNNQIPDNSNYYAPSNSYITDLFRTFINSSSSLDELRQNADIAILLQGTNFLTPTVNTANLSYLQESCIFDGVSSDLTLGILPRYWFSDFEICERFLLLGRCVATLFGANLDRTNSPLDSLVSTAHGFYRINPLVPWKGYRTVDSNFLQNSTTILMARPELFEWANYYSNPLVIYRGVPTGDDENNNAAFLTERRFLMASIGDESRTSYRHDFNRLLIMSESTMEIIDVQSNMPLCSVTLPFTFLGGVGGLDYDDQPFVCGEFRSGYSERDCYTLSRLDQRWSKSLLTLAASTGLDGRASFDSKVFGRGRMVALANTNRNAAGMNRLQYLSPRGWILSQNALPFITAGACVSNFNSTAALILPGTHPTLGVSNRTYIYDFVSDQLFPGPDRPVASQSISCARMTNATTARTSIVVAGGQFGNGTTDRSTYILDVTLGVWTIGPPLPVPILGGQLIEHPTGGVTYISNEGSTTSDEANSIMFFLESPNRPWKQMIQMATDCTPFNVAIPVPNNVYCPGLPPQ